MEAELTALAASGATTLVGLMVTDAWSQARGRVARFFARGADGGGDGGDDMTVVDGELRRDAEELAAGAGEGGPSADAAVAVIEERWRERLRVALRADPGAADELRQLLAELDPGGRGEGAPRVHNSVTGGTQYGPVIQGERFSGLTFDMRGVVPPGSSPER
ncbi:hypothetical protein [Streptomyces luteireticuli]|uniref:Uncharacterized protein n=1 Tax=Streptomyces luteireticuli TaxID=173858 RepID=A0ABN0YPG3_9ACTN